MKNRKRTMKTYRFLSLLVLVMLLLSACGAQAPERPPLKVGWSLWPGWYPLVIAQEKGFFEKHGLEVELSFYPLYGQTLSELDSGKVDAGALVVGDALPLTTDGNTRIVMITDNSNGGDSIVASSDITSPADLRGKRIGVGLGTFGEVLVREMLKQHNISVGDVTLVNVAPENLPAELGKTVDAGHTYEPFTTQAIQSGYSAIFSSAETPGLIPDVFVFRSSVAAERPEDVRAFIAAFFEAQEWWLANPDEGAALIAQATGLKPEEVSADGLKLFNQTDNINAFRPGEDTTSIFFTTQLYTDFQIQTGRLNFAPDLNQLLDASFLPQ
jgi:NitT/TauT family transport system substrate-binding protein